MRQGSPQLGVRNRRVPGCSRARSEDLVSPRTCAPGRSGRVPRLLRCSRASRPGPTQEGLRPDPGAVPSTRSAPPGALSARIATSIRGWFTSPLLASGRRRR